MIPLGVMVLLSLLDGDSPTPQPQSIQQTTPVVQQATVRIDPVPLDGTQQYVKQVSTPQRVSSPTPSTDSGLSNDTYYTNSAGNQVHSPAYSNSVPVGASAQCRDGTYSFSQSRRGTCSHHGGVALWL